MHRKFISKATMSSGIVCFTDGSCIGNGKKGAKAGYAVVYPEHPEYDLSEPLTAGPATNNRAEYMAVIRAIETADLINPGRNLILRVYTDSALLVNSLTKWRKGWKAKGWKKADGTPVMNLDLLQRLDDQMGQRVVLFHHVRAHTGGKDYNSVHNDRADKLARAACDLA